MGMKSKWLILCLAVMTISMMLTGCGTAADNTAATLSNEESNNRIAEAAVHIAAVGLGEILKDVKDENQRLDIIRKFIDPIRFFNDQSGYFFVYNYDCVNLAHAIDKTIVGKDLTDYKDMKGNLAIQELSARAKSGGGFVTFWWPHPQSKIEMKKLGYVEPIPGTQYFIGTGYYPDTK